MIAFMSISQNYYRLVSDIERTALKFNTDPKDITLVCVSKNAPAEDINELLSCGAKILGENRVSEILKKYDAINKTKDTRFHLIGHLQTNKVSKIIDKVSLIHSLDSIRLALEIDRQAALKNKIMDVLVEINISREQSKHGILKENIDDFLNEVSRLKNIGVKGLMCIGPLTEDQQEIRRCFRQMHKLFIDTAQKKYDNIKMDILSMGMTNDYKLAIECGSNMLRVGSAIFKNTL
jgi:pyridoxal phosphate enzyme (YggS family)